MVEDKSDNIHIPQCISSLDNRLLVRCVAEVVAYNVPLYTVVVLLFFAILSTLAFLEQVDGRGGFCKI